MVIDEARYKANVPDLTILQESVRAMGSYRAVISFLQILTLACFTRGANAQKPTSPAGSEDREHAFLLWKLDDVAAAQAKVSVCERKQVSRELASICTDAAQERKTEAEIATGYLFVLYAEKPPSAHEVQESLAPLDGSKFATTLLKQMIRLDNQGLERARSCQREAKRPEILKFCHLVERSRSAEILLWRNQLCEMQNNCRSHWLKPQRPRAPTAKDLLFRQSTNEKRLLKMVEEALRCIHDGSFGLGLSCGNEINAQTRGQSFSVHAKLWQRESVRGVENEWQSDRPKYSSGARYAIQLGLFGWRKREFQFASR